MRSSGRKQQSLDLESYAHSHMALERLGSYLPPDGVEDFAREVIRRLTERRASQPIDAPSEDQIEHLCFALLDKDEHAGAAYIRDILDRGASPETVYLKYLAEAARRLGQWWNEDLVAFADVALGTTRIFAIIRELRPAFAQASGAERSAVFTAVPGDTHTLGVRMAADLFRKNGWKIDLKLGQSHDQLVEEITRSETGLIGISAGGQHALPALSRLLVALRISAPYASIFVGGQVIADAPEAVAALGVDGMASDIDGARDKLESLWQTA